MREWDGSVWLLCPHPLYPRAMMLSTLPQERKEREEKREERALENPATKEKVVKYDRRTQLGRRKKVKIDLLFKLLIIIILFRVSNTFS